MKRFTATATALTLLALSAPVHADPAPPADPTVKLIENGLTLNGFRVNGIVINGKRFNGAYFNGLRSADANPFSALDRSPLGQ